MLETMRTLTGIFQTNPIYRDALEHVVSRIAAKRTPNTSRDQRSPASSGGSTATS